MHTTLHSKIMGLKEVKAAWEYLIDVTHKWGQKHPKTERAVQCYWDAYKQGVLRLSQRTELPQ